MLRLSKYFKPYLLLLLIAIALLFVQANADLALPDYLSKIVNIGIQAGGVENAIPHAIRQSQMNRVVLFLSAPDQARLLNDYTLVDSASPDYSKYVALYPNLKDAPIYVLKTLDQAAGPTTARDWIDDDYDSFGNLIH